MILDTCALLWLAHDQSRLSQNTLLQISRAPVVSILSVTGFEIGLKHMTGKLHLPVSPGEWIDAIVCHHQIDIISIDMETCIRSTQLPPIHKDPCDRFIIAAALVRGVPVVTSDVRFAKYGVTVLS